MATVVKACIVAGSLVITCLGHGQVVLPPPRNAIDSDDPAQAHATYHPHGEACPVPAGPKGTSGKNGQSCYWFSNGAGIGCPVPDGTTRGPIPSYNCTGKEGEMCRRKMDHCGAGAKATVCDPALRTVNTAAACGADDDWYYYSPWRAPGSSGIYDSCGMAGGTPKGGGFGGTYVSTKHAKQGDLGSKLPPRPTGTTWKAGSVVEVSWNLMANHGGGYQYRLCPASSALTEECFFKTPLAFVGKQSFRWDAVDGKNGKQFWFEGTYVSKGTLPKGSTWARNPVPRNDTQATGHSFKPLCEENPNCGDESMDSRCLCSGMWGPYNMEIVDTVQLPGDLPSGDYVLGWRWDCEESNQIWTSCSDVTILGKDSVDIQV